MQKKLSDMTLDELWHLFPIQLTAPNPKWSEYYSDMAKYLSKLLLCCHPKIHHIGSTAISGIWAKPIVDILIELETAEIIRSAAEVLAANEFIVMSRDNNRISLNFGYTEKGFADKVYHIHLRIKGDCDEVYFKDYLNCHPDTAKEYEKLKLDLWQQYEFNRDGYTEAKTEFVKKYTELAKNDFEMKVKEKTMNFTIEHKKAFTVIGISTHIEPSEGYIKCPQFWDKEYNERYSHLWQTMKPENEEEQAIFDNKIGMLAVCMDGQDGFEYMIAGEYQGGTVPNNMKLYDFSESDWAIFKAKGPLPTSLQTLNTEVWQHWYPNEGQAFLPNGSATIEHYSMGDQTADDYECEIWIPVIKK